MRAPVCVRLLAVAIAAGVIFPSWALEWEPVPAGEAWLQLEAPGLESVTPMRRKAREEWVHMEHARWIAPGGGLPSAEIYLMRIDDLLRLEQTFVLNETIGRRVQNVFSSRDPVLGQAGVSWNDFEDLEYQYFVRRDGIRCIFMRQGRSTTGENLDVIGSGEPIGDMKLEGWYCARSEEKNLDWVFAGFVKGIGVKGYAEPESPHPGMTLEPRRR